MLGEPMASLGLRHGKLSYFGAKEAVCPFDKFPEVDPVLGPEMRSTGEVLGLARNPDLAFCKSQEAAGAPLPEGGAVLASLSVKNEESARTLKAFTDLGFKLYATPGTKRFLDPYGIESESIAKIGKGRPNVLDLILNKQVQLVINTPSPRRDALADGSSIRKAALKYRVPYMTTLAAAEMSIKGIAAAREAGKGDVESIQEYHASIQY